MKQSLINGLDKQEQADIKASFAQGLLLRKRLGEVLKDRIDSSNRASRSKTLYDSPGWAYLQADARGYERAINEVIELLL